MKPIQNILTEIVKGAIKKQMRTNGAVRFDKRYLDSLNNVIASDISKQFMFSLQSANAQDDELTITLNFNDEIADALQAENLPTRYNASFNYDGDIVTSITDLYDFRYVHFFHDDKLSSEASQRLLKKLDEARLICFLGGI